MIRGPVLLYVGSGLAVVVLALVLMVVLPHDSFAYSFLFRFWPVQLLNTWFLLIGLVHWMQRYSLLRREEDAFQKLRLPQFSISREEAPELIRDMPEEYRHGLTLRRFRELLQAFLYGEDIIRLNEELSRRDMAEVERGHLILNSLKSIIPVVGFLGTVTGLSLGMVQFPDAADAEVLRTALRGFAASLSVAFDTTLLALGYTIVIILLASFLRQREETLVSKVDERARTLVDKIKITDTDDRQSERNGDCLLAQWNDGLSSSIEELLQGTRTQNEEFAQRIEDIMQESDRTLCRLFEEMKQGIHRPPHYRILVQPVKEPEDDEE